MIGLSGLITPSLDEMVHVAQEMQRQGFDVAAADRRRHDLAGAHRGEDRAAVQVARSMYVKDASRSVGVLPDACHGAYARRLRRARSARSTQRRREQHARQEGQGAGAVSIAQARANRRRDRLGRAYRAADSRECRASRCFDDYPLEELLALHRLDAVLQRLGVRAASSPTC